jgi:oligopeptidase B
MQRRWSLFLPTLVILAAFAGFAAPASKFLELARAEFTNPAPPVAERRPVRLSKHGIERVDPYAWLRAANWNEVLRDPSALAPEIRAYIEAENRYAEAVFAPLSGLRVKLVEEMKGRIEEDDSGVPAPSGGYAYWTKFIPGAEHEQIVRSARSGGPEELLVDGFSLAEGKPYYSLSGHRHSPDHRLYGYMTDETGSEQYRLRVRDIGARRDLPEIMADVSSFAWSQDSSTLFYVKLDENHRPLLVFRHRLGTDPAHDQLIYKEHDPGFEVAVASTRSGRFVVISSTNDDTSEQWLIESAHPERAPRLVAGRDPNVRYSVDDWGDRLVIRTNADGAEDYKIVTAPASAPGRENWRDLLPHQSGRHIVELAALAGHLIRLERDDGVERLVVRRKADGNEYAIWFGEEAHSLELGTMYEFNTTTIRFRYSSLATPKQTFDYDVESQARVLRKQQKVPSGHDPSSYVVQRLTVPTDDEETVPVTLLYRNGVRLDGSAPLFLEGYGAYSYAFPTDFDSNLLSLVDRGFIYAIAHIRGGIEKGERWRNLGRLAYKINSFKDFIAVAEYLSRSGYTSPGRIVACGDSAGGLVIGAVANVRPDLFAGMIARVPFVDVLNTTLDDSLPLTVGDFTEWGDPIHDPVAYRVIASYSPYDNVSAHSYPHMLVTAGIRDPRVPYWEPAKWVAKIRAMKTNNSRTVLVTNMSAGHHDVAGRFASLDEVALVQAFALEVSGMRRPNDALPGQAPPVAEAIAPDANASTQSSGTDRRGRER